MIKCLIISCILGLSSLKICAQIPLAPVEQKTEQSITPPNPLDLQKNWWSYFSTDDERAEIREKKFYTLLDNIRSNLPIAQQEKMTRYIDQIKSDFIAIKKAQDFILEKVPLTKKQKDSYTFEEFIALGSQVFDRQNAIESEKEFIQLKKRNLKEEDITLTTLFEKYDQEKANTTEKLFLGLKIITSKLSMVSDSLQINQSEALLQQQIAVLDYLNDEVVFARQHLIFPDNFLEENSKNIQSTKIQLDQISEKIQELQKKVSYIQSIKSLLIEDRIVIQELLLEKVHASLYEAKIRNLEIQKRIFWAETKALKKKRAILHANISKWNTTTSAAKKNVPFAINESQINLQYAFRILSQEAKTKEIAPQLAEISQKTLIQANILDETLFQSSFLIEQLTLILQEKYTSFGDRISSFWLNIKIFLQKYGSWLHKPLFKIGHAHFTLFTISRFLLIIFIAYILAIFIRRSIRKFGEKHEKLSQGGIYTLSRLIYYTVVLLGLIIAIATLGVDFTALAVIAGALSVGIGFGLQSIFNNFIAGIILLLEKSLRVGDFIQLESGDIGTVKDIKVRTTLIKTLDNLEILIPNSDLVLKKFTNWTLTEKVRRVRVPFSVAYGSNTEQVRVIIINAAKNVPITLQSKEPDVWLKQLGDNGIEMELVVWVNEYLRDIPFMATALRYLYVIEKALTENKIKIPYPVRDVNLFPQNSLDGAKNER